MKKLALVALALALGLALLVTAGCGDKVPAGAIATVGGVPITQAQFDQYINQAKASASTTKAAFPSGGTTAYYRYAAEIVNYLVEQQLVLNGADKQKLDTLINKGVPMPSPAAPAVVPTPHKT